MRVAPAGSPAYAPIWLWGLAAGVGLGLLILTFSLPMAAAAAGALALLAVVAVRPEFALILVLVLTSTIFSEDMLPTVPFGPVQLYMADLIFAALVAMIGMQALLAPRKRARPASTNHAAADGPGWPQPFRLIVSPVGALLLAFVVWSTLVSLRGFLVLGNDTGRMIPEMRTVGYYLFFLVVVNLVHTRRQIRLLTRGLLLLTGIMGIAMLWQYLLGSTMPILPGRVEALVTEGESHLSVTRIIAPGEALVLTGFITLTTMLLVGRTGGGAVVQSVLWALGTLGTILTFNRNFWLGAALAFGILTLILLRQAWPRLLLAGAGVLVAVAVLFLVTAGWPQSRLAVTVDATAERLLSFVRPETFDDSETSTLRWRDFEYHYGLPSIKEQPLLGLGMGAIYRPFLPVYDHANFDGRGYSHNAYLWVGVKTGLPGLALLVAALVVGVVRGLVGQKKIADPEFRGVVLGFSLTIVAVMFGSIVNPMLMQGYWTPLLGIMLATNEAILRWNQMEHQEHA